MTDEKTALERRQELIDAQPQRAGYYRTDYAEGHYNGAEEEGVQPVDWARWVRAIFKRKWLIAAIVAVGTAFSLRRLSGVCSDLCWQRGYSGDQGQGGQSDRPERRAFDDENVSASKRPAG